MCIAINFVFSHIPYFLFFYYFYLCFDYIKYSYFSLTRLIDDIGGDLGISLPFNYSSCPFISIIYSLFFLQYCINKGSLLLPSGLLFAKKLYSPNLLLLTPHIFNPTGSLEYKLSISHLVRCSISGENFFHV